MSLTGNSHTIVKRGSRVSRTPPYHTLPGGLPAILNLHGMILMTKIGKILNVRKQMKNALIGICNDHLTSLKPGVVGRLGEIAQRFDNSDLSQFTAHRTFSLFPMMPRI